MMIRALLTAAAITLAATAGAGPATAHTHVGIGIGFGFGGAFFGPGPGFFGNRYYGDPYFGYRYVVPVSRHRAISCSQARQVVRWRGFRNVRAIDCRLPNYRFTGWRGGRKFTIRVNSRGTITRITRW